ncbi:MAG: ATP-binding cassette domain-containing protein [Anaerolineaceae bacterium]|nr:ATP-binding cassette domain-containing protein [Anaerolineaceae bacterium]
MIRTFHLPYSQQRQIPTDEGLPALEIHDLSVGYRTTGQNRALDNITLCVPKGQRVALVGPNGAGKSTLLKAIVGLLPVLSGDIQIFGQPIADCRQRVAYLPQRGDIDWRFPISLRKLVLSGRYVHLGWFKQPRTKDWAVADEMIARLGLTSLAARQIGQLSGGQQQRALLARALAQEADLILLDEPLNAVDADTRAIISDVLDLLQSEGKTIIAATHDLGRLESDYDSALYLADGHEVPPPPGSFVGTTHSRHITSKSPFHVALHKATLLHANE